MQFMHNMIQQSDHIIWCGSDMQIQIRYSVYNVTTQSANCEIRECTKYYNICNMCKANCNKIIQSKRENLIVSCYQIAIHNVEISIAANLQQHNAYVQLKVW